MNILPRFLYLFQSIPVFLPKSFFRLVDKLLSSFLWGNKHPRIRKVFLQRHKTEGGMALPNLMYYYWAANLQKIVYWIQSPDVDWCQPEIDACISSSLPALVTSKLPLSPIKYSSCPIVISTLKIWSQFRQNFNLTDFSLYSPICNNHVFLPAKLDPAFVQWQRAGLSKFSDLYIDGTFATFDALSSKFNLQRSNLFRYLQIRRFVHTTSPCFPNLPPKTGIDIILQTPMRHRGLISKIYNSITSLNTVSLDKIRADWVEELGINISDATWDGALYRVNGSTSCARLGLIQFKVLHRIHYSRVRLSKMYSNVSETCDRCQVAKADLAHMFWSCDKLYYFWTTIFQTLSEAFSRDIQPSAEMAIFGVPGEGISLQNKIKNVLAFSTLLARRRILLEWKSSHPPKASSWMKDLILFLKLEKIKYCIRGSTQKFHDTWAPLLSYFEKLEVLPQN